MITGTIMKNILLTFAITKAIKDLKIDNLYFFLKIN